LSVGFSSAEKNDSAAMHLQRRREEIVLFLHPEAELIDRKTISSSLIDLPPLMKTPDKYYYYL
jgi:hypothetical protein